MRHRFKRRLASVRSSKVGARRFDVIVCTRCLCRVRRESGILCYLPADAGEWQNASTKATPCGAG
ncbi:MAG: hypothetical protein HOW73_43370 [Polyangiaceae bacterium]|nr:hypothetical protein [Polyangiaceae bacterium]